MVESGQLCTICHTPLPQRSRFCLNCGQPVLTTSEAQPLSDVPSRPLQEASAATEPPSALDRVVEYMTGAGWAVETRDADLVAFVSPQNGKRVSMRCPADGAIEQLTGIQLDLSAIRSRIAANPGHSQGNAPLQADASMTARVRGAKGLSYPSFDEFANRMIASGWRIEHRDRNSAEFVSWRDGKHVSFSAAENGAIKQLGGQPIDISRLIEPHRKSGGHVGRNLAIGAGAILSLLVILAIIGSASGGSNNAGALPAGPASSPPDKAAAEALDPRQLAGDPNAYKGQNIALQGKALNVEQHSDYTWINLQAGVQGRDTTEPIVVEMRPKVPSILEDECYRLYGVANGTQQVKRLLTGATNDVPLIDGYAFDPAPRDQFGIGCAAP